MRNKELILNPYFIIGLSLLLINDFYLKQAFGNFLTGKLSDFAGLLIFPLFIATVAPRFKKWVVLITGIGFILWKLPIITPIIDSINHVTGWGIYRTIDYTDYMALSILPLSYYLIKTEKCQTAFSFSCIKHCFKYALLGVSFFAFCATTLPPPQHLYKIPQGTVYIGKSYTIKLSKDSIINTIKNLGYNCDYHDEFIYYSKSPFHYGDSVAQLSQRSYYQTDNIIQYWKDVSGKDTIARDTIANIKYDLEVIKPNKTKLTIINVTLPKEGNIQDWKKLQGLHKQYKEWLKMNLIKKID
ncbi:hypothetical protein [Bacteroides sp. 224]|uniref:hypothetical protein n=1 Tax=Bacteroides sp. 224 TaxID=2302936 RepID=UPI0013D3BA02|nr:hypothetical protein [Bacteroides sp. 224]NDV65299.1 hypothetical protein [Bacteroides sp. 224]